jgi:uncharacterized protein
VFFYDVNVLIYAHRGEIPAHASTRDWFQRELQSDAGFYMAESVLASFIRIVTNPQSFKPATSLTQALRFVDDVRSHPGHREVLAGPNHFDLFKKLCVTTNATGKLVADAYLAAMAMEHDLGIYSFDRDFARFPGLKWQQPPVLPTAS